MHWQTIGIIAFTVAATSSPLPAAEPNPLYIKAPSQTSEWVKVNARSSTGSQKAARSIPSLSLKRSADADAHLDPIVAHVRSVNRAVKRHAKRAGIPESSIKKRSAESEWVYVKRDENGLERRFEGFNKVKRGLVGEGDVQNVEADDTVQNANTAGSVESDDELVTTTAASNVEMLADPTVTGAVVSQVFEKAVKPDGTTDNAVTLNEDGNDIIYFSEIAIGSKGKKFTVNMDTGSSDLWVPGAGSESTHSTLAAGDSSSLKVHTDKPFTITYGTGKVSGVLVQDKVSIAGMDLQTTFGAGTTLSSDFNNFPADGILGLASSKSSQQRVATPLERLAANKQIKAALVGIHLQRADEGNNGVINFGEVDPKLIVGGTKGLNFNKNVNTRGQYECNLDDVTVNGKSLGIPSGSTAIIDTGTTQMLLPSAVAMNLNSMLSTDAIHNQQGVFAVPCDTKTSVMVKFGGISYPISPKDYIGSSMSSGPSNFCLTRIGAFNLGGGFGANVALFGDVFLKNVYSVYDLENNQVGFGVDKLNNGNQVNAAEYIAKSNGGPTYDENNSKAVTSGASSVVSSASRKAVVVSLAVAALLGLVM